MEMTGQKSHRRRSVSKGAAGTEYALLLGLISALTIGSLVAIGMTLGDTYEAAAVHTANPGGPSQVEEGPDMEGCFTDGDDASSNTFDDTAGYDCFYLNGGDDALTWTSSAPVFVSGGSGAEYIVTGAGNDIIEVAGANAGYEVSTINSGAGDDTIRVLSGILPMIDAGAGDDILDLDITSASTETRGLIFHDFTAGSGRNHTEIDCAADLGVTLPNVVVPRMTIAGDDIVTLAGCSLYMMTDTSSPSTGKSLDLLLGQGAQAWDMGMADGVYSGIVIAGSNHGGTSFTLPTDADKMLGDYDIDLAITYGDIATSLPIGIELKNSDASQAIAGPDRAARVRIDTSPLAALSQSPYASGSIRMINPQSWMSAEISGEADPLRESSFSFQLDFASDPSSVSTSVPSLKSDGAGLFISIGKRSSYSGYSPTQCWDAILQDSTGTQGDMALPCGAHEFVMPGYAYTPSGGSYVTRSLESYDRLTITDPIGHIHEINFNGNPGPGGGELTLRSLRILN